MKLENSPRITGREANLVWADLYPYQIPFCHTAHQAQAQKIIAALERFEPIPAHLEWVRQRALAELRTHLTEYERERNSSYTGKIYNFFFG